MADNRLPILITAIGGGGHGEQILKALHTVNCGQYFIVGADAQSYCPQSIMTDRFIILPRANEPDYMEKLLSVCEELEIRALFHGCEPELKLLALKRSCIEERGIFLPINPTSLIDVCMDKIVTNRELLKYGFSVPQYIQARTIDDLNQIDWFPVIVKPSIDSGGSANVYIAQTKKELLGLADYLGLELIYNNFIIQEYVGTPDDEYTVGVLHDMDGNYINSIAVKKLFLGQLNIRMAVPNRTGRSDLGKTLIISSGISHGYVGRFPEVTEQCKEIAKVMGVEGPINIQCRLVNGVVKVFEINPRFSGTTSVRAMVGYNEPDILIRKHILNETILEDFSYEEALILRGISETRVSKIDEPFKGR